VNGVRNLARLSLWLFGKLQWIKTYQPFYRWDPEQWEDAAAFRCAKPKKHWRWGTSRLVFKLLRLSERLDRDHWEHWALSGEPCGEDCVQFGCVVCRGVSCFCGEWDVEDE
jgi:hypothetical protein